MKRLNFIFITCSALLLLACKPQNQATAQLTGYLETTHALKPNDSSIYCFFPANQCKNCFLYHAKFIKPNVNRHVVIISEFDSSNFKGFQHFYRDKANKMIQLEVLDYGNRIITFKNGTINNSVAVKDLYAQLDSAARAMDLP